MMYRTRDDLCTMAYADTDRPIVKHCFQFVHIAMSLTAWHSYIIILYFEFGYQFIVSGTEILRCVSWDFSLQKWTTQGCMTSTGSDGVVLCHCNHLTNFAVIMVSQNNVRGNIYIRKYFRDDKLELY